MKCAEYSNYRYIGTNNVSQVFLDELNTSTCGGIFKEIIVDRTMNSKVPRPYSISAIVL